MNRRAVQSHCTYSHMWERYIFAERYENCDVTQNRSISIVKLMYVHQTFSSVEIRTHAWYIHAWLSFGKYTRITEGEFATSFVWHPNFSHPWRYRKLEKVLEDSQQFVPMKEYLCSIINTIIFISLQCAGSWLYFFVTFEIIFEYDGDGWDIHR